MKGQQGLLLNRLNRDKAHGRTGISDEQKRAIVDAIPVPEGL